MRLVGSYLYAHTTTDARDDEATGVQSQYQAATAPFATLDTRFDAWLARLDLAELGRRSTNAGDHAYALQRGATAARHQMSETEEDLANVLWAVEHDLPVVYIGGGTAGTDSPITGAGTLVVSLAGALCGLTIMQLCKRGAPVCIGSVPEAMDLRTGRPPYGGPETSLYSAALSDICKYLGLPFMGTAGTSESKVLDLQAAIESSIQVVFSALSGATLVHDVGFLDCAQIGSLESLVMNDEIIAMTRRILRGVEVNDDTLMLDLIDRVGPGGSFLSTPETSKRCRTEIWNPTLMDRQPYTNWLSAGAQTMNDRIHLKLKNILETHQPPPLPDGAAEKIDRILHAAEKRETSLSPQ